MCYSRISIQRKLFHRPSTGKYGKWQQTGITENWHPAATSIQIAEPEDVHDLMAFFQVLRWRISFYVILLAHKFSLSPGRDFAPSTGQVSHMPMVKEQDANPKKLSRLQSKGQVEVNAADSEDSTP